MSAQRMKASVRFRENQKPLYRLKAPLNFLGLPLFSGFSMGEKEELALQVGTGFEVGPSVRFAYRPNDKEMPTSLVVKAGLGPWASAGNAVVSLSAEFDLGNEGNTRIMLKTAPRFGDFSLRRSPLIEQSNSTKKDSELAKVEFVNKTKPQPINGFDDASHVNGSDLYVADSAISASGAESQEGTGPLAGLGLGSRRTPNWGPKPSQGIWALKVHSGLPLGGWGFGTCRWQLNVPKDLLNGGLSGKDILKAGLPTLVLDKVSVEAMKRIPKRLRDAVRTRGGSSRDIAKLSDDVITLHAENSQLKRAIEELRGEFARTGKKVSSRPDNLARGEIYGREEAILASQALKDLMQDKGPIPSGKDIFKKQDLKNLKKGMDIKDAKLKIPGGGNVSAELQKAIMSAQGSG